MGSDSHRKLFHAGFSLPTSTLRDREEVEEWRGGFGMRCALYQATPPGWRRCRQQKGGRERERKRERERERERKREGERVEREMERERERERWTNRGSANIE